MFTNRYIFTYATIMIIIVASVLATAANILKPFQDKNEETEKIKNILSVAEVLEAEKKYTAEELASIYEQTITETAVIGMDGNAKDGLVAFDIDMAKEVKKEPADQDLPVFIADIEGKKRYIIPLRGSGLWGPIWGFFAVDEDGSTILGANFGHKGETPGLGAEIDKPAFGNQFVGKRIFDENGAFKPVQAIKGGAIPGDLHGVDAISGGTITCNGLNNMLSDNLKGYEAYFKNLEK